MSIIYYICFEAMDIAPEVQCAQTSLLAYILHLAFNLTNIVRINLSCPVARPMPNPQLNRFVTVQKSINRSWPAQNNSHQYKSGKAKTHPSDIPYNTFKAHACVQTLAQYSIHFQKKHAPIILMFIEPMISN